MELWKRHWRWISWRTRKTFTKLMVRNKPNFAVFQNWRMLTGQELLKVPNAVSFLLRAIQLRQWRWLELVLSVETAMGFSHWRVNWWMFVISKTLRNYRRMMKLTISRRLLDFRLERNTRASQNCDMVV